MPGVSQTSREKDEGGITMCSIFGEVSKSRTKSEEEKIDPVNKYLREFEASVEEITVLLKDASKIGLQNGDILFPGIHFIAYIDNKSGEVVQEKGTLDWVIPNFSGDYIFPFEDYDICRVLVRKCRPDVLNPGGKPYKNRYHVVELLRKNVAEPRLEAIRKKYLTPVSIEDSAGTFRLDRKYNWFEGQIDWQGSPRKILLDKDSNSDTADRALQTLHLFLEDVEKWDQNLRDYAARQLTELANDWRQENIPMITQKAFAKRIGLPEFWIHKDGSFEVEYEDDNMFYGHWVVVYGDANGELKEATIEG